MRVACVLSRSLPHTEADAQQTVRAADALARAGVDIHLLAPAAPRNAMSHTDQARLALAYYGLADSPVAVHFLPPTFGGSVAVERLTRGRLREFRLLFDAGIAFPLARLLRQGSFDLVHARRWLPVAVASWVGVPAIYETHSARAVRSLMRFARPGGLAGVIAHSEHTARALVAAGLSPERVRVCYNGYSAQDLEPRLTQAAARASLGLKPGPLVVYTGRLKHAKAPHAILQVAQRTPQLQYVLVGSASATEADVLSRAAAVTGIHNVRIDPWCPPTRIAPYLHAADILIVPPSGSPLRSRRTILPLKTFLYLAAGKPIVAPALDDVCEVLTHDRNAVLVPPDDPEACARALEDLIRDPQRMQALGRQAAADAQAYTWDRRALAVADFFADSWHHSKCAS